MSSGGTSRLSLPPPSSRMDPVMASFSPLAASSTSQSHQTGSSSKYSNNPMMNPSTPIAEINPRRVTPRTSSNLVDKVTFSSPDQPDRDNSLAAEQPRGLFFRSDANLSGGEHHGSTTHKDTALSSALADSGAASQDNGGESARFGRLSISGRLASAAGNSTAIHSTAPHPNPSPSGQANPVKEKYDSLRSEMTRRPMISPLRGNDLPPKPQHSVDSSGYDPTNSTALARLVKDLVGDSMASELVTLRNDIQNLHVDLIKRDIAMQTSMRSMLEDLIPATLRQMTEEIRLLKEENARLRLKLE